MSIFGVGEKEVVIQFIKGNMLNIEKQTLSNEIENLSEFRLLELYFQIKKRLDWI